MKRITNSKNNTKCITSLFADDSKASTPTSEEGPATRCIDCSKDSCNTKKFANTGMNTELSLNPDSDLDLSTNISVTPSEEQPNDTQQQTGDEKQLLLKIEHPPKAKLSPTPQSSLPTSTSGISFSPHRDYSPVSMIKTKQNGRESEAVIAADAQSPASPTYIADVYNGHHKTHIRYPALEISSTHYDRFLQSHPWAEKPRYELRSPHRVHLSPTGIRRSPKHHHHHHHPQQRARSPLSPRTAESRHDQRSADYPLHYHGFYEKYRPVLLPTHPHGRTRRGEKRLHYPTPEDDQRETAAYLRQQQQHEVLRERESPHGQVAEFYPPTHLHDKHHRSNVQPGDEPPVFVLPNDYDVVSGIDPRVASLQERRSAKYSSPPPPSMMASDKRDRGDEVNKLKKQTLNVKREEKEQQPPRIKVVEYEQQKSPPELASELSNGGADSPDSSTAGTTNSQKLYCKICSGVFPTKSLLYKHLRGHTSDEKPFKCNECGQGFTLSSNLRQHRIIHRGYKPFQCEFCGKKFMRSNVYKQHRRIHTGEEMHKCGLCPSEFLQKYALLKHMKKNHDIDAVDN